MQLSATYCTFRVDRLYLGIDVLQVQEVIHSLNMTRVPLTSRVVRGLINLRGQILTAIDLRRRLELGDRPSGESPMNVVIRTETGPMSLLVDEIGDVVEVDEQAFEPRPETLKGAVRELIRGAYKLKDGLLLILHTEKVLRPDPPVRGSLAADSMSVLK
jgi:purine-binding chemotaxis protein CheW